MGTTREFLNYIVIIKPYRKSGNGAKGGGRKGNSGKIGSIYKKAPDGKRELCIEIRGATLEEVARKLRRTGLIPAYVSLREKETRF